MTKFICSISALGTPMSGYFIEGKVRTKLTKKFTSLDSEVQQDGNN
ncbi:MAG: hypothetical protein ACRC51_05780 [Cetobacterium sp.]